MTELTRKPTTLSSAITVCGALLATVVAGAGSTNGLFLGLAGVVFVAVGLYAQNHSAIDIGGGVLFVAVILGATQGGSVESTLLGAVAAVVAWDIGQSAIDLGEQLGREADTTRLEAVHAGTSTLVGLVTVTFAYALYVFAAGGQPVAAVVLLLAAAALVTIGLGVRRSKTSGRRRRRRARY